MNMSNLTECVPIGELKLEEKPETTFTTITNVDFISNLPDSLLCHILSFLPTRTSVATSVLSRRWRHLWKDLNVLDLADESLLQPYYQVPREDAEHDFVNFVGNFLHQVRHIHKFRLSCDILYHRDALEDWINAVTGPYLQELYLRLSCRFSNQLGIYVLPHAIFTCTSLVSLTLERDIFVEKLQSVHLPSLKNLKLEVIYANLDKILSGCPSLETLNATSLLGWSNGEGPRPGSLHMPHSLKSLTFVEVDGNGAVAVKHLVIDTPSLEYLDITLSAPYLGVLVSNFPNMMEARVDVFIEDEHVDWVPKVLKALCKTRMLLLTCSTMLCLLRAPAPEIPEFSSLLRLEIEFPIFSSRFLLGMLHNCHRLQVLMIQNNGVKSSEVSSDWPVPNCVISHLNIVEFRGYQDSVEEHEFTAYILQKGLVLKTMTIHTCPYRGFDQEEKDRILMEVSTIPRGSSICQLKLD